jgi:hypothetical protein
MEINNLFQGSVLLRWEIRIFFGERIQYAIFFFVANVAQYLETIMLDVDTSEVLIRL